MAHPLCARYVEASSLRERDNALRAIRYALEQVGSDATSAETIVAEWRALAADKRLPQADASALAALTRAQAALYRARLTGPGALKEAASAADRAGAAGTEIVDDRTGRHLRCLARLVQFWIRCMQDRCEEVCEGATELRTRVTDLELPGLLADIDHMAGLAHRRAGRPEEGVALLHGALQAYNRVGDDVGAARVEDTLGMAYMDQGNYREAQFRFERSLVAKAQSSDRAGLAVTAGNAGRLYAQMEDWDRAIRLFQEDVELSREIGDEAGELTALLELVHAHAAKGDLTQARSLVAEAHQRPALIGNQVAKANLEFAQAQIELVAGNYEAGHEHHEQARKMLPAPPRPVFGAHLDLQQGLIEAGRANYGVARSALSEAIKAFDSLRQPGMAAKASFGCAMALLQQGFSAEVVAYLVRAIDDARSLEAESMAQRFQKACESIDTETWMRTLLEVKRLNEKLAEEQAHRQNTVDTLVHDIRSTTNRIRNQIDSFLKLVAEDTVTSENLRAGAQECLGRACDQCGLLAELTSSILDARKLEAGESYRTRESVRLKPMIEQLVSWFAPWVKESKGLLVRVGGGCEDVEAWADTAAVRRVLINLIENARKYTHARDELEERDGVTGYITSSACREGAMVRVSVTDTGPGIPEDACKRIFDRFGQIEPGVKATSTGIGLCFCKHAVEALGGQIGVESEVGEGSTFWFTLPAA